jgi:hypothetical protein
MTRPTFALGLAAALLLPASAAQATETHHPITLHMVGGPRSAISGRLFTATIEIEALQPVVLSNFTLASPQWSVQMFSPPPAGPLDQGQRVAFSFEAVPSDIDWPLVLSYFAGNEPASYSMNFTPRAVEKATTRGTSILVPRDASVPTPKGRPSAKSRGSGAALAPEGVAAARDIRVEGVVCYARVDGVPIGADQVRIVVFHRRNIAGFPDEVLGSGETAPDGSFDLTFHWDENAADPDLYVEYSCLNDHVQVSPYDWFRQGTLYTWVTPTLEDFAGDYHDFQMVFPEDEADFAALHMHTVLTRAWRWLDGFGHGPRKVVVRWPETGSTNAHFSSPSTIFIPPGTTPGDPDYVNSQRWTEGTLCHEYGHHFLEDKGNKAEDRTYDNGICDQPGNPRHCDWCEETAGDAWNEGFSDWFGDVIPRSFTPAPWSALNREALAACREDGANWSPPNPNAGDVCPCDPRATEGPLSALLHDIEDCAIDDEPLVAGTWRDVVCEGAAEVLRIAVSPFLPETPMSFLYAFAGDRPDIRQDIWETAKNNGYEMDVDPPFLVTNLTSPSHHWTRFGAQSPDATVDFTWTLPNDDFSGVVGYSFSISEDVVEDVDAILDIFGAVTSFSSAPLPPGQYYFNIRAVDRAGNWNVSTVHYGPFHIKLASPTDLVYHLPAGWDEPVVPRGTDDATLVSCLAPATLPGNQASTYWNVSGRNIGDDATESGFEVHVEVDGGVRGGAAEGVTPGHMIYFQINQGPLFVTGGRHTMSAFHDGIEEVAEVDEGNNKWGKQWIWTPLELVPGVQAVRAAPPDRDGGWGTLPPADIRWFNCDGLRFSTAGGDWHAVWMHATKDANDYDCRLHVASTGASDGFAGNVGWSSRPAGALDAVIVNRTNTGGAADWDVGIIEESLVTPIALADYRAKQVTDTDIAFGSPVGVTLPAGEMLILLEFRVLPGDVGPVSVTVDIDPADGPLHVLWFADDFTRGSIDGDYDAATVTDATGRARLDFLVAGPGFHCLAIFRDPGTPAAREVLASEAGSPAQPFSTAQTPVDMTVEVFTTPPDFNPFAGGGWYAPLVPRAAPDGSPSFVPPPGELPGEASSTFLNTSVLNPSPTAAAGGMVSRVYLDGVDSWLTTWGPIPGGAYATANDTTARMVRGGRHTLTLRLDDPDVIEEWMESNNVYGEQWIWRPAEIPVTAGITRMPPPSPMGGLEDVSTDEALFFNCDGLRTPLFAPRNSDGYWAGVAIMPSPGGDADARLHETSGGAKDGFGPFLRLSAWGPGHSDYLLANFNNTPFRAFDVGVLDPGGGGDYFAETASSIFRGAITTMTAPAITVGPVTMGPDHVLDLHEFFLVAGTYRVRLESAFGKVDWGVTLHGADEIILSKSTAYVGAGMVGTSWLNPAGQDEQFDVIVLEEGFYCVAAWKARSGDLSELGTYLLHVGPQVTDVPGSSPVAGVTRLAPPWPNPVQGAAVIRFSLAQSGLARLGVYDIRGARVRMLVSGQLPGGDHVLEWNGLDEAGRRVRSGVYQLRLEAEAKRFTRKLVLLE